MYTIFSLQKFRNIVIKHQELSKYEKFKNGISTFQIIGCHGNMTPRIMLKHI